MLHNPCRQPSRPPPSPVASATSPRSINVNLTVEAGQFFGFLGPNGAGKSTTIKMMTGLLAPTSGTHRASRRGLDATHSAEIKRQIGVVPEGLALFGRLTAGEYLRFVGRMYGLDQATTTAAAPKNSSTS
jgi:ABC-2 type transport system ATP-binding protein